MYHDNRIAIFVSHLYGDFQRELCQGAIDKAEEFGYRIEIYCSNDGEELGDYVTAEENILRIPDFQSIDGAIFVSGPYIDRALCRQIATVLLEQSFPVVEIAEHDALFPSITLSNCERFRDMAEHLIRVHKARRICYLGVRSQAFFSERRLRILREALTKHDLAMGDDDVFFCETTSGDYAAALRHFTRSGAPDAIICYNDYMAVRLWDEARLAGYRIPRDFAITGCDFSDEGQTMDPPLTTITFPAREMGAAAVTNLVDQMHGRVAPVTPVQPEIMLGGSCGCGRHHSENPFLYQRRLYERIVRTENTLTDSMRMAGDLSRVDSIGEGIDVLERYVRDAGDYSDFFLCLYAGWDAPDGDLRKFVGEAATPASGEDSVLLKLALHNGERLPECTFRGDRLLPDFIQRDSDAAYIISPVFFGRRPFGYLVRAYRDNCINYRFLDVLWLINTAQMLQNVCDSKNLRALTRRLESVYFRDPLTGLYNRHGLANRKGALLQAEGAPLAAALIFDVDNLRAINDQYGRREGDFALLTMGQALKKAAGEEDLCARYEGDEFYILVRVGDARDAQDLFERVKAYLANFNRLSSKPYRISVSGGLAWAEAKALSAAALDDLMEAAEEDMRRSRASAAPPRN